MKLLKNSGLSKDEQSLVLTGMNFDQKDKLYDDAKKSLQKFKGNFISSSTSRSDITVVSATPEAAIKLEPAWMSSGSIQQPQCEEEAYVSSGRGQRPRRGQYQRFGRDNRRNIPSSNNRGDNSRTNPTGQDGNTLLCRKCGSFMHFVRDCPHASSQGGQGSSQQDNKPVIRGKKNEVYYGNADESIKSISYEVRNHLILDSACSSSVCGQAWFDCFLDSLNDTDRGTVKQEHSNTWFTFGGDECLCSKFRYTIPVTLANKAVFIQTDVVDSSIPLLWSRKAMKAAGVKLDIENDSIEIFGEVTPIEFTSSGHMCLPCLSQKNSCESVYVSSLYQFQANKKGLRSALLKLHRQFAHPAYDKLVALLKDAGQWSEKFAQTLHSICDNCNVCKQFSRTPSRPVVSLPMATTFNEMVAMDLKLWRGKLILHMIDMFSRLTVSIFVRSKHPAEMINGFLKHWVGAGYGVPKKGILTDNGGEYNNEEVREMASMVNINVATTGAESPFQNGLAERNHAIVDSMLEKLVFENPSVPVDILLCWANMAKNSLQMWSGFSSFQIVFGQNPVLPNLMTDGLPAMEGKTQSQILANHLNALHSARRAFIQTESSERIRRAMRSRVRASEEVLHHGDMVYYKREKHTRWLGPAKVLYQDGKVVFIRHGGAMIRASPTRIKKQGREFDESDVGPLEKSPVVEESQVDTGRVTRSQSNRNVAESFIPVAVTIPVSATPDDNINDRSISQSDVQEQDSHTRTSVGSIAACEEVTSVNEAQADSDELTSTRPESVEHENTTSVSIQPKTVNLRAGDTILYGSDPDSEWTGATVLGRAGKITGKNRNWFNIMDAVSGDAKSVDLGTCDWVRSESANVVTVPRTVQGSQECVDAKMSELEKLKRFNVYDIVDQPPDKENCVSSRWVLTYKGEEIRARLVARGFEETHDIQVDAPTVSKSVLRMFLTIVASSGWDLKTTDIKSAFLQGKELERDVFLNPPKEAGLPRGKSWKLKRCLYGLNDAARQFYVSVSEEMQKLGCIQSNLDTALFMYKVEGKLTGIIAMHIDDFLHAGLPTFESEIMDKLRTRFLPGKIESGSFKYIGFDITQSVQGIEMRQDEYVRKMACPSIPASRASDKDSPLNAEESTQLRSMVGALNWAVQGTRPD